MTRLRKLVLAWGLLLGLAASVYYQARLVAHRHDELKLEERAVAALAWDLARLRDEHAVLTRDLAQAEQQLGALRVAAESMDAERARQADLNAWLARAKKLLALFRDSPERQIAELQLLTAADWLRLAKRTDLGDEEKTRLALASVRTAAKGKLSRLLTTAVEKYRRAENKEAPANALALLPYFDSPIDPAILARYEIIGPSANGPIDIVTGRKLEEPWSIRERTAIDEDYDSRAMVGSAGTVYSFSAPGAWIPDFRERLDRAIAAYRAANGNSRPSNLAAVLPYANPPFPAPKIELLIKAERAND